MTKGRAAMWAKLRTGAAVLSALGLALACGKAETTESGETHFVTCSADTDCKDSSDVPTCSGGFCRDSDGNKIADTTNSSTGSDDGPQACASGCGNSECGTPGSCTVASACKLIGCDTALVDAEACVRPACESDADCPEDERCLSELGSRQYECSQVGSRCDCTAGLGLFAMHVCSPVALAGSRGTWQELSIDEIVIGQSTKRTFLPDGSVTIVGPDAMGQVTTTTKQLSPADLDTLNRYIDGAELRLGLATQQDCEITKATDLDVQLVLDTTTLEQNVAGCAIGNHTVPIFQNLYDLSHQY
ncbi:MAG TPA: hypothetical protein VHB79_25385 [Polyangiaceae bacterium]|nr:hypothetical protein [Polyangiaceae bacterium]